MYEWDIIIIINIHIGLIFTHQIHTLKTKITLGEPWSCHTQRCLVLNTAMGGSIFEMVTLGNKYNLNPIYAMEGYIVADANTKDNGNYHIMIIPRNNEARKKLNLASSRANMFGYYYKPRLFLEDLLKFNKDDFYLTTACCGGLLKNKDSFNDIFLPLYEHFKENILLEVQTHNVDSQKRINERALKLSKMLGLKIIHANDSHYIYPEDAKDRLVMLEGKGIT